MNSANVLRGLSSLVTGIGTIRGGVATGSCFAGEKIGSGMSFAGTHFGKGLSFAGTAAQKNPRIASLVAIAAIATLVLGALDGCKKIRLGWDFAKTIPRPLRLCEKFPACQVN